MTTPSAFYQFPLGELEITVIQDGAFPADSSRFGKNMPEGTAESYLRQNNLPPVLRNSFNILLIRGGDRLILIDTGLGESQVGGKLLPTLQMLGVTPEAITDVVITHFHGDHVGGISSNGVLAFPNAMHHIAQVEWDFLNNLPAGAPPQLEQGANNAKAKLQPAISADQMKTYRDRDEVLPGLQALFTPGHTPGHHSLLITSGNEKLLVLADTMNSSIFSVEQPTWYLNFDFDPEQAVKTRLQLLNRATDEGLPVAAYHFSFPGIGYISRDGEGFRFRAAH